MRAPEAIIAKAQCADIKGDAFIWGRGERNASKERAMSLTDIMSHMQLSQYPVVALVIVQLLLWATIESLRHDDAQPAPDARHGRQLAVRVPVRTARHPDPDAGGES